MYEIEFYISDEGRYGVCIGADNASGYTIEAETIEEVNDRLTAYMSNLLYDELGNLE